MLAFGGLLISTALLLLAAGAVTFRQPNAPLWTTWTWVHELGMSAIVCLLAIGIGYLAAGAMSASEEGPSMVDLGLLIGVLTVATVIWRRLDVRARLKASDAAAQMQEPAVVPVRGSGFAPARAEMPPARSSEPPASTPKERAA